MGKVAQETGQGRKLRFAEIAQGSAGTSELVAAVANAKIKVVSYVVILDAAGSFKFTDDSDDLTGAMPCDANGGAAVIGQPSSHLFETGLGEALSIVTVTGKASGHLSYFLET